MNVENFKPISYEVKRFSGAHKVLSEAIAARAFPGCAFGVLAGGKEDHPIT